VDAGGAPEAGVLAPAPVLVPVSVLDAAQPTTPAARVAATRVSVPHVQNLFMALPPDDA
jgi:hypothetical protein